MGLQLYNTLTRSKEEFTPREKGKVSLYTCGPTVYGPAHIGNLRTYVFEDVLRRWLKYGHDLEVTQAMNITDVEDKIIANSEAANLDEMAAYTAPFTDKFKEDLGALNIEPAEHYPTATAHVPQMIELIERVIEHGYGYEKDGSVYFDVQKYHQAGADSGDWKYGELLNLDLEHFDHHRIDNDEYDKESVQDFALWKVEAPDSPGWDSPWGFGRPGWHIECSAMAREVFGGPIDIHTGGVDNVFPHHENEIAQTRAATGEPLAAYWLHGEHLLVDEKKMAKSAGNYRVLGDVTAQHSPLALRLLFLQAHYRSKLNFTEASLSAAAQTLDSITEFVERVHVEQPDGIASDDIADAVAAARQAFTAAMDDDLGTPEALAAVFELMKPINSRISAGSFTAGDADVVKKFLSEVKRVTGLFGFSTQSLPIGVARLLEQRQTARETGEYEESDRLRDEIEAAGYVVKDTVGGQIVRKRS